MSEGQKPYPKKSGPIPNVINDDWSKYLKGNEFKIVFLIARKTFGFRKEWDKIAISQMAAYTGLSERTCQRIRNSLVKRGVVLFKPTSGGSSSECCEYSLNMGWQYDTRDNMTPVTKRARRGDKMTPQGVTAATPTKLTLQNSQIQNTHNPSADMARCTELIKLYSKHVQKVDPIALDYRLRQAQNANGPDTVEHCLEAIIQAAQDQDYPKDKLPGSLSALLGNFERVEWWAKRYKKPEPQWWDTNSRESVIDTLVSYIGWGQEIPDPIKHLEPEAREIYERRQSTKKSENAFAGVA